MITYGPLTSLFNDCIKLLFIPSGLYTFVCMCVVVPCCLSSFPVGFLKAGTSFVVFGAPTLTDTDSYTEKVSQSYK